MIVTFVFAGLVLVGLATMCVILQLALSLGPWCPACGRSAVLIRSPWPLRLLSWLEQRWCLSCGWHGLLRRGLPIPAEDSRVDAGQPRLA